MSTFSLREVSSLCSKFNTLRFTNKQMLAKKRRRKRRRRRRGGAEVKEPTLEELPPIANEDQTTKIE